VTDGVGRILELAGRNMPGFVENGVTTPSIVEELRLPAFVFDVYQPYSWPLDKRMQDAVVLAIRA
jgi:hypothetical protein